MAIQLNQEKDDAVVRKNRATMYTSKPVKVQKCAKIARKMYMRSRQKRERQLSMSTFFAYFEP
jgi:hypothetical protein